MKVITRDQARITQFFVPDEITPPQSFYVPAFIQLVADRYGAVQVPTAEDAAKGGAKFGNCVRVIGQRQINIRELGFYNDGIIVETSTTLDSEAVVDDLMQWARDALGFRQPLTIFPRRYRSAIVADYDVPLEPFFSALRVLTDALSEEAQTRFGVGRGYGLRGFHLDIDPKATAHLTPTGSGFDFHFERRVGTPYESNRYYSNAPLPTDKHLELLKVFEARLISTQAD